LFAAGPVCLRSLAVCVEGAALLAALKTMNATPEQVEEKKKECSTSSNLQSEINNLI